MTGVMRSNSKRWARPRRGASQAAQPGFLGFDLVHQLLHAAGVAQVHHVAQRGAVARGWAAGWRCRRPGRVKTGGAASQCSPSWRPSQSSSSSRRTGLVMKSAGVMPTSLSCPLSKALAETMATGAALSCAGAARGWSASHRCPASPGPSGWRAPAGLSGLPATGPARRCPNRPAARRSPVPAGGAPAGCGRPLRCPPAGCGGDRRRSRRATRRRRGQVGALQLRAGTGGCGTACRRRAGWRPSSRRPSGRSASWRWSGPGRCRRWRWARCRRKRRRVRHVRNGSKMRSMSLRRCRGRCLRSRRWPSRAGGWRES
jgi:hypothetical protein